MTRIYGKGMGSVLILQLDMVRAKRVLQSAALV